MTSAQPAFPPPFTNPPSLIPESLQPHPTACLQVRDSGKKPFLPQEQPVRPR